MVRVGAVTGLGVGRGREAEEGNKNTEGVCFKKI